MIPSAKLAQKTAKLRAKRHGTLVTLKWQEWPNGKPTVDPTSGAALVGDNTSMAPVAKSATVHAFVHFISPITSGRRVHAEVQVGDAIVDWPLTLYQITDAGGSDFTVGQVVDEVALGAGNRGLVTPAIGDEVEPHTLENVSLEFGGHTWMQKSIGEGLAEVWDTIYSDISITRAMLVTKQ